MKKVFFFSLFITAVSFSSKAQSPATYQKTWTKTAANQTILRSPDGNYTLLYQGDGNLCLYNKAGKPIWATMTNGKASTTVQFQEDGNLVIYNGKTPIWGAQCHNKGGSFFSLQNDGNLCIYTIDNKPIWATMTNGK